MAEPSDADVYVDVVFDEGLLFLVVCNDGPLPARQVRVKFAHPLRGADQVDVSELGIFRRLEFLAPGKRIEVFLDHASAHFAKRQRSQITLRVSWRMGRRAFDASITHDMRAYADLPHIVRHPDNRRVGHLRR